MDRPHPVPPVSLDEFPWCAASGCSDLHSDACIRQQDEAERATWEWADDGADVIGDARFDQERDAASEEA